MCVRVCFFGPATGWTGIFWVLFVKACVDGLGFGSAGLLVFNWHCLGFFVFCCCSRNIYTPGRHEYGHRHILMLHNDSSFTLAKDGVFLDCTCMSAEDSRAAWDSSGLDWLRLGPVEVGVSGTLDRGGRKAVRQAAGYPYLLPRRKRHAYNHT